jgi:hypothetical protein
MWWLKRLVYGFSAVEYSLYAGRRGYTTPLGFIVGLELAIFVQPISFDTFSLWPAPGRVLLSSAKSGHSRYKENPACAGFLNGDYRPGKDIPYLHMKVRNAAYSEVQILQSDFDCGA